jgi:hypothetical protein
MINGGTIPCNVQNLSDQGDHYFEASFVPDSPKPHKVEMKFNNKEVTGILLKPVQRDKTLNVILIIKR